MFGFPLWIVATHFVNVFLMLLLARSGLEVLSAFPKFYWSDHCPPGLEWLRFTKKVFAADSRKPWSSLDEEESWSPILALPGKKNLGLGRHWHFFSIQLWIINGLVFVGLLVATGYWRTIVPTTWSLFPNAVRAVGTYLQFQLAGPQPGLPFNAAQQLTYFLLIFVLAPLQIATGAAMSPAIIARFPWYARLFGGKQGARSLHFLGLCAFAAFVLVHTAMVVIHGVPHEFAAIVLGSYRANPTLALAVGLLGIAALLAFNAVVTVLTLKYKRQAQIFLGFVVDPFERVLVKTFTSRERFTQRDISPFHRVNGYPPPDPHYKQLSQNGFADFRLEIGGLVENPQSLSLAELRDLGWQSQITKHNCIQGWTATAKWSGVPLSAIVELVRPAPNARHVVFFAFDDKTITENEGRYGYFYGSVPLFLARNPQTILALEMNDEPLPVEHGAPVRVRFETQLGFKMVKWIKAIEFVEDYRAIGQGQGGWREDQQYYANAAGI